MIAMANAESIVDVNISKLSELACKSTIIVFLTWVKP